MDQTKVNGEDRAQEYGYEWDGRGGGAYIWCRNGKARRRRLGKVRIGPYGVGLAERVRASTEMETRIVKTLRALRSGGPERERALQALHEDRA